MTANDGAEAEVILDCVGRACPIPMMETAKRIRELVPGQVLVLLADDPTNPADMYAWCRLTGHEYLGTEIDGAVLRTRVRKSPSLADLVSAPDGPAPRRPPETRK